MISSFEIWAEASREHSVVFKSCRGIHWDEINTQNQSRAFHLNYEYEFSTDAAWTAEHLVHFLFFNTDQALAYPMTHSDSGKTSKHYAKMSASIVYSSSSAITATSWFANTDTYYLPSLKGCKWYCHIFEVKTNKHIIQ